jgi:hypothetical protein
LEIIPQPGLTKPQNHDEFPPAKEEVLYIIDLSKFKRLTWVGGISVLVIVALTRTNLSFGFYVGFMTALALAWYAIHLAAKKIDHRSKIIFHSDTRDS